MWFVFSGRVISTSSGKINIYVFIAFVIYFVIIISRSNISDKSVRGFE